MYGSNLTDESPLKRPKLEPTIESQPAPNNDSYIQLPDSSRHQFYLGQEDHSNVATGSDSQNPLTSLCNLTDKAGFFDVGKPGLKSELDQTDCSQSVQSHPRHAQIHQQYQHIESPQVHAHELPAQARADPYALGGWQYPQTNYGINAGMHENWGYQQQSHFSGTHNEDQKYFDQVGHYDQQRFYCHPNSEQYGYNQYGYGPSDVMTTSAQHYSQQGDQVSANVYKNHYSNVQGKTAPGVQYMAASAVAASFEENASNNHYSQAPQHYSYSSQSPFLQQALQQHHHQANYIAGLQHPAIKNEQPDYNVRHDYRGLPVSPMVSTGGHGLPEPYRHDVADNAAMLYSSPPERNPDPSAAMLCAWDSMEPTTGSVPEQFITIETRLSQLLQSLSFGEPVTHIYNPIEYAIEPHRHYVSTFCKNTKKILFLGMNPGPYGMGQTGVPFGEINMVKDWLKVEGAVQKPLKEHPKRPVWGLECPRSEISGSRFWGFFKSICETPDVFFRHCFVHNYCPLLFMAQSGRNLTPPDLRIAERRPLNDICDRAFCDTVRLLDAKIIVGVGKFAQERAKAALRNSGMLDIKVECIMHPSPANPTANKGWQPIVERQLREMGAMSYFVPDVVTGGESDRVTASAEGPATPDSRPPAVNSVHEEPNEEGGRKAGSDLLRTTTDVPSGKPEMSSVESPKETPNISKDAVLDSATT